MSSNAPQTHPSSPPIVAASPRRAPAPSYKSWKKKFRKMKRSFDSLMQESDSLFHDETRAHSTAKRLAEQNDHLLSLLLDVNDSVHIPPEHRFRLGSPTITPSVSDAPSTPHAITSLTDLLKAPHASSSAVSPVDLPSDLLGEASPTCLSPAQLETYLSTVDATLSLPQYPFLPPLSTATSSKALRKASAEQDRDDAALRNPMSVYNWLRKHQPQVFLQDHEISSDRAANKVGDKRGAGKRASVAALKAASEDVEDDDVGGRGADAGVARKRKRERDREEADEESAYRPRNGIGSEGKGKRKREREDGEGGRGKVRKVGEESL